MGKILFDGVATQSNKLHKYHGGGEYAKFILREALLKNKTFDIVFLKDLYTDPDIVELVKNNTNVRILYVDKNSDIYNILDNGQYDRFYSALPMRYSDYPCKQEFLGVIHGLRNIELSWDYYRYKFYKKWYMRFVAYIISNLPIIQRYLKKKHVNSVAKLLKKENFSFITVSNHTKYSILNVYPFIRPEQLRVYYSPFSIDANKFIHEKENYFLMVSGNRFEKNIYRCVKAFDKLFTDGRLMDKHVVITGCTGEPFWNEVKNRDKFVLLQYVSTEKLQELYSKAFCLVYPSLNEGFGYPPIQAMACGTPVIASTSTSIPEVCGDAACYFSPTNIDDLCSRILRINDDKSYRTNLVNNGNKRVDVLLARQDMEIKEELDLIFG